MRENKIRLTVIELICIISIVFVLCISIIGATYAYFRSVNPENLEVLNATANIADNNGSFIATGNNIALNVPASNMQQINANNVAASDSKNLTISYLSGTTDELECKYDIYYKWSDGTESYTITDASQKEFTYSLSLNGTSVTNEKNFVASSNTNPQAVHRGKITNASATTPTVQNYTININYYNIDANQANNADKTWKVEFYIDNVECGEPETGLNLLTLLQDKVFAGDSVEGNGSLINQDVTVTQNATLGLNSSSYTNIIYTGPNPNNFIEFNGEMWRIIGVYNEDSHGIAGQQLVKIIRNDSLGSFLWDYKYNGVGSNNSSYNYGSNEWSDSQLMFMLNGESALNKGKLYNGNTYTYANTQASGNYIQASQNSGTYYNIWNKSNGSYLSYDANGEAYTNKTIYTSSQATTSSYPGSTGTLAKTLSRDAQSYIQEVTWHLGGWNTSGITPANFYNYERNTYAYNGSSSSTTSTTRSTTWTGKIGLMYPSDYGYATSGGTTTRNTCLGYNLNNWSSYSECYTNDWVLYPSSTATKGSAAAQWTISPHSSIAFHVFNVFSIGAVDDSSVFNGYAVRPVLYLVSNAKVTTMGDGSYATPYVLTESN